MRDRMKKKVEKSRRKLVHQLLDAALDINGLSPRKQELTGNSPTAFLNFSGHVGTVEVQVHLNGWESGQSYDLVVRAYTDKPNGLAAAISRLKAETPAARTARGSE